MFIKMVRVVLVVLSVLVAPILTHANLSIYEGFNYTTNSFLGDGTQNGGSGFEGAWVGTDSSGMERRFRVDAGTISIWNLSTEEGTVRRHRVPERAEANRLLSASVQSLIQKPRSELWFSVLLKKGNGTDTNGNEMAFALASAGFDPLDNSPALGTNEVAIGFRLTEDLSQIQCAQWHRDLKRTSKGSLPYLANNLIIGRIQFCETDQADRITLWNLSSTGAYDLSQTPKITYTAYVDQSRLSHLSIFDNAQQRMDEIRMAVVGPNQTSSDALAEVLPGITNITIPDLYVSCTARDGTDVSTNKLINSDFIRLDGESIREIVDYSYQYQVQANEPISWTTNESLPFWENLFFYREPETQWVRLTLTDVNSNTVTRVFGLEGGVLTAPVDDPIDPWDYMEQCGVGYNWRQLNRPGNHRLYSDPVIFYLFKKGGFSHFRLNHGPDDDDKVLIKWRSSEAYLEAIEDTVDRMLRHGLYPILTGGVKPYESSKDSDTYTRIGGLLKYKSHRLAFEYCIEIGGGKWTGKVDPITGMYENMGLATQNATDLLRAQTTTHNIILGGILADTSELYKYIIPTGLGEYYAFQWHRWASGIAPTTGIPAFPAERDHMEEQFENIRLFSLKIGKPFHTGAMHTRSGGVTYVYTTEVVKWIEYIKSQMQTAPDGREIRIPNTWIQLAISMDMLATIGDTPDWYYDPFRTPVFETLNGDYTYFKNDRDGDGLSNAEEIAAGTSPDNVDTDGDNMGDNLELIYRFDPLDPTDGNPNRDWAPSDLTGDGLIDNDADGDGMLNADELNYIHWNESSAVTREDALDPWDPTDADLDEDHDGISTMWEVIFNTNPFLGGRAERADRDGDNLPLLWELTFGYSPFDAYSYNNERDNEADPDGDGGDNKYEITRDTHPRISNSGLIARYNLNAKSLSASDTNSVYNLGNRNSPGYFVGDATPALVSNTLLLRPDKGALRFDGDGDCVLVDNRRITDEVTTDRTLLFYFKPFRTNPDVQILYEEGDADHHIVVFMEGSALRATFKTGTYERNLLLSETIYAGNWYHVAVILDETLGRFRGFLNGVLISEIDSDQSLPVTNMKVTLGGLDDETTQVRLGGVLTSVTGGWFSGLIDEVMIYKRAFSDTDMTYLADLYPGDRTLNEHLSTWLDLNNSHIVEYTFSSGDAADTSSDGSDNSGSLNGDATVMNGALVLDGNGDYLAIPPEDLDRISLYGLTVSLSFKAHTTSPNYQVLYHGGKTTRSLVLYLAGDTLMACLTMDEDISIINMGTVLANKWEDVTISFFIPENCGGLHDAVGKLSGFRNGNYTESTLIEPPIFRAGSYLGNSFESVSIYDANSNLVTSVDDAFNGVIDNVRIYHAPKKLSDLFLPPRMGHGFDVDGDQLPDSWETTHLGGLDSAAEDDDDADGLSNAEEYFSGTHPTNSDSALRFYGLGITGTNLNIAWRGGTNVSQWVFSTTNLNSPWWPVYTNAAPTPIINQFTLPVSATDHLFFKIEVDESRIWP